MLGPNVEKTLQVIDKLMVASASLSVQTFNPVRTKLDDGTITGSTSHGGGDSHDHGAGQLQVSNWYATEVPQTHTVSNVSKLRPIKAEFDALVQKIQMIDKNVYVKKTDMHNSIGSPYTEIYRLQEALNNVVSYTKTTTLIGEHVNATIEAGRLLNRTIQLIVDAKWAVIQYADYLERGFEYIKGNKI
jgi:hypothetical protein